MLKRLGSIITDYCRGYQDYPQYLPDEKEWRQVDYFLNITEPFYKLTTSVSKTKYATVHNVSQVYERLFGHMQDSIKKKLENERDSWKRTFLHALQGEGESKLHHYYAMSERPPFNVGGTIRCSLETWTNG